MAIQPGSVRPRNLLSLREFDFEISNGLEWISLNDHMNFRVAAESLGETSQQLRRITADSPYFDGTYLVHSTKENITEQFSIYVLGTSQNHVTENLLLLEELISQVSYRIRLRLDDHMETWTCQPADYSIDRTHVYMHNVMAIFKVQVPRLPKATFEVIM